MSFQTQSFKTKYKKVKKTVRLLAEGLIYSFFLVLGVINGVKIPYKKKNYGANFPNNLHSKQDPQPLRQGKF